MESISSLNDQQEQAVNHTRGPLLIVAGAGTGKTSVVTQKIVRLIQSGEARQEQIVALTFSEKAAREMEDRVSSLLGQSFLEISIGTFHAFCDRILSERGLDSGLPVPAQLITDVEAWVLVRNNLDRFHLDYYRPRGNPLTCISALLKHISRLKDEEILPDEYIRSAENLSADSDATMQSTHAVSAEAQRVMEIARAYHEYQQLLLEKGYFDFGDLITYTLTLFRTRPSVLAQYREDFRFIIVDEFQDTNFAQYELVKLLAGKEGNITVVGDDDQAIYKFRGASISNILNFKKDYPHAKEVVLTKNYRSKQNILDLSYAFIQHNNPDRLEFQMNHPDAYYKEKIAVLGQKVSKRLLADRHGEGIIECILSETLHDEVSDVVNRIEKIKDEKNALWGNFAILVRANDSAEPFIEELKRRGIPYICSAPKGLYFSPVFLDIVAYLRLLLNPYDDISWYRLLELPIFRVPFADAARFSYLKAKRAWGVYDIFKNIRDPRSRMGAETILAIEKLLGFLNTHVQFLKQRGLSVALLHSMLDDLGYIKYLLTADHAGEDSPFSALNSFFEHAQQFMRMNSGARTLQDFLNHIDDEISAGESGTPEAIEKSDDAVHLMSVHASKGLEFCFVFIVSLVAPRFPTIARKEAIEVPNALIKDILPEQDVHLQEERRLFYVAMTRAKDGLFFSFAKDYGGKREKKPSRFLEELGILKDAVGEAFMRPATSRKTMPFKESLPKVRAYPLPQTFSHSQLKTFQTCPLKYKYQFVLKIPVPGKYIFSFGTTMHSTLQQIFAFLKQKKSTSRQSSLFGNAGKEQSAQEAGISLDDMRRIFKESWIDDWYESEAQRMEFKNKGLKMLEMLYHEYEQNGWPSPIAVEKGFRFLLNGEMLTGRIDRADSLSGGKVELIDYKTGSQKDAKTLEPGDRQQLLLYQLAWEAASKTQVARLSYHYLENNSKVSFEGTEADKQKLRKNLSETIQKIKQSAFEARPGYHCNQCDYRKICPFAKVG